MQPAPIHDHSGVQALFVGQGHHLAIQAVLAGVAQGQVFAVDARSPQHAVLWTQHRVYLAGSPGDPAAVSALRKLLATVVAPQAYARGDYAFGLYYAPDWHKHLPALLPELRYDVIDRQYYVADLPGVLRSEPAVLPAGFRLAPVDAALLAQTQLGNHARLIEETCSERPSVEDFLARSFGVCILHGDALAGWCLSEYNCGSRCEVGIETVEEYGRRGLGTLMTLALCQEAVRRHICQVGWHCVARNVRSAATARRAGLRLALEYPSAVVWLRK